MGNITRYRSDNKIFAKALNSKSSVGFINRMIIECWEADGIEFPKELKAAIIKGRSAESIITKYRHTNKANERIEL